MPSSHTPSASVPAPPFFGLPFELVKFILEQCDDYRTLHTLRGTCKAFKNTIDNDPFFDKVLFRNRPLTNPTLTGADIAKIWSLEKDGEEEEIGDAINTLFLERGNPYIDVHPALSRAFWSKDACSSLNEISLTPELTIGDVPHVLKECATWPPVCSVGLGMEIGYSGHLRTRIGGSYSMGPPEPVLVEEVLSHILGWSQTLPNWNSVEEELSYPWRVAEAPKPRPLHLSWSLATIQKIRHKGLLYLYF
ncbi:unnamed protein product [Tilletia controversa]|uniref:F-box domain-containing protein n=1 Tax=Tilletia controversa TaxID=13291 RepID=A0A8X7SXQ4_9BASI|nr:hypothetical protein CF328_g2958 [Tilletia controversa]KAE8248452.1 hypothetical protein A4X06_0g3706 [Tilletia controversa]CAD6929773.1 unnamed protein product [Tilletia controversa]CAD6964524.1 unnamed protein product [Tilletia controversa]CAD6977885.1 unnamed protein product [Tilletia controversa]